MPPSLTHAPLHDHDSCLLHDSHAHGSLPLLPHPAPHPRPSFLLPTYRTTDSGSMQQDGAGTPGAALPPPASPVPPPAPAAAAAPDPNADQVAVWNLELDTISVS